MMFFLNPGRLLLIFFLIGGNDYIWVGGIGEIPWSKCGLGIKSSILFCPPFYAVL